MEVDDVTSTGWELQPWPHNVLVTADEHGRGGEQESVRAYQKLSNTEVAVDAVLFFPAGTIAFGHAAGWTNATESAYANTHAWAGAGRRRKTRQRRYVRYTNLLEQPRKKPSPTERCRPPSPDSYG